ncbi:MAG: lactoylglutathione lyase, partial [Roseovarius sp.]
DRLDFEKFTLVYMSNDKSPFEVELTINKGRTEPYDRGDGYGHLAVLVEDLAAEHARFEAEGLNPRKMVEFAPDGKLVGKFFFVADPDGYEIEVLERGGRFK